MFHSLKSQQTVADEELLRRIIMNYHASNSIAGSFPLANFNAMARRVGDLQRAEFLLWLVHADDSETYADEKPGGLPSVNMAGKRESRSDIYLILVKTVSKGNDPYHALFIGFTKKPEARIQQMRTATPYPLELLHSVPIHADCDPATVKTRVHALFTEQRIIRQWFRFSEAIVKRFKNACGVKLHGESVVFV